MLSGYTWACRRDYGAKLVVVLDRLESDCLAHVDIPVDFALSMSSEDVSGTACGVLIKLAFAKNFTLLVLGLYILLLLLLYWVSTP